MFNDLKNANEKKKMRFVFVLVNIICLCSIFDRQRTDIYTMKIERTQSEDNDIESEHDKLQSHFFM